MYRNATDFWVLILCPTTLLNSCLTSNNFLVAFLAFLYIASCHWQIMTVLLLSFQFGCLLFPFFYSVCLIAVARMSNTMLNKSGGSGQPCLVPDLSGHGFSFSTLRMMLAVGLSYITFIMLR